MQELKIWVRMQHTLFCDNVADEFHVYDDALAVKKIASSDISQVILEETGQQAQSTIIIDTTMVIE